MRIWYGCFVFACLFATQCLSQTELLLKPGVDAWLNKACFSEGEEVLIYVRVSHDSYLAVVNITPEGVATLLFPNTFMPKVFLSASRVYELPPRGSPLRIKVSVPSSPVPSAKEKIWIIATEQPLDISPFANQPAKETVANIRSTVYRLPFSTWWAATVVEFEYGPCREKSFRIEDIEAEIDQLNREIIAAGAEWIADVTPLSGLPLEELRLRCGVVDEPIEPSQMLLLPLLTQRFPSLLDWRNINGNWTTPIKDQGPCGSCWIFSPVAVFESLLDISGQDPADSPQDILSEQYVLSYIKDGKGCGGGHPGKAMDFLTSKGTVTSSCFPYTRDDSPRDTYAVGCLPIRLYKWAGMMGDFSKEPPTPVSVEKIKHAIYTYGPVVATMAVYEDFFSYRSGIYTHVKGKLVGRHAVVIVGWADNGRYWICKNSWGPLWGERGWFRIRWGNSSIGYMVFVGATEYTAYYINMYGSLYEYVKKFHKL